MLDPRILGKPAHISEEDMVFHKKLVEGVNKGQEGIHRAHAEVTYATQNALAANRAMETWMGHLGEKYGLKPNDVIDMAGNFGFQDQGWAAELQAQAVAKANAEAEAQAEEDGAPTRVARELPPIPDLHRAEVVALPTPPEGAEDAEFPEGDFLDAAMAEDPEPAPVPVPVALKPKKGPNGKQHLPRV